MAQLKAADEVNEKTPRAWRYMRRVLWAVIPGRTAQGYREPALLSARWVVFMLMLPWSIWASIHFVSPIFVVWNCVLVMIVTVDDFINLRSFREGQEVGRREMCLDMMDAWEQDGIGPGEYLIRELTYDEDEIGEARRVVAQSKKKPGRHTAELPIVAPQRRTPLTFLPQQVQRVLRRSSSER